MCVKWLLKGGACEAVAQRGASVKSMSSDIYKIVKDAFIISNAH